MVAIAETLIRGGHEAHLLADVSTAGIARAHGVRFTPLAGNMKETVLPGGHLAALMKDGGDLRRTTRAVARIAQENTTSWMASARDAACGCDVLVISGLAAYVGLTVAEELDRPCVGAGLWPMTPTREFASPFLRPRNRPGWVNLMSHRFFSALAWMMFRSAVNDARKKVFGKAPRRRMWKGYPILYGCSPTLLPRPADWPPYIEICGAWHVEEPSWQPPEPLAEFLAKGDAPIYIGFGSMAGFDTNRMLMAIVEAVGKRRALFYPGWSGMRASLPSNFHVLGDTPHAWLFPKTLLVIHHGGAGTTHAAARSGVPSVVIPFAGDQFFWADRLEKAGGGVACPSAARLDGRLLGELMARAGDPAIRSKASAIGCAMREEEGNVLARERLLHGVAQRIT